MSNPPVVRTVAAMILLLVVVALVVASLALGAVLGGTPSAMPGYAPPGRRFNREPEPTAA